jgi:hypothetical protein
MSRIGKNPVAIPAGVAVELAGQTLTAKGALGALSLVVGNEVTATTFIQRLNTSGGIAPSAGCASPTEIGNQAFVSYTADYVFYKKAGGGD